MRKKTVIVGSNSNPSRYAYLAAERLNQYGYEFVPLGIRKGKVIDNEVVDIRTRPEIKDVDTITMYIGPQRQPEWYEYLLSLKPKRIIFNPGTENPEFEQMAESRGIETIEGCTLVMLRSGQY
jgi:predicted CoA-binding protein